MTKRIVHDTDGTRWEVSEGYMWAPLRHAEPGRFLVFRDGAGAQLRARGTPALETLDDPELRGLLADARRAASPALRTVELRAIRLAPGFHLPLYAPQLAAAS